MDDGDALIAAARSHSAPPGINLRLLIDALPALVAYVDAGGRYRLVNRAYESWFGRRPEEIYGRHVSEVIGEEAFALVRPHFEAVLAGKRLSYEARLPYRDGGPRDVHVEYVPDFAPDGAVRGYFAMINDISERRREEARRAAEARRAGLLARLADALRGAEDGLEVMQRALRVLREHLDADRTVWAEVEPDDVHVQVLGCDVREGVPALSGRFELSTFGDAVLRELRAGRAFVCRDALAELPEGARREAYETTAIRATIGVPLHRGGRFVAGLGVHMLAAREWTVDEVELMREAAQRCWEATERARAERALRENRDVLRLAMRAGRMGAWSRDFRTGEVWWSLELEEIFGLAPGSFGGNEAAFFEQVHPDDRDRVGRAVGGSIASGEDYSVEFRFRHASGEWRWMDGRGRATYNPDGSPAMLYGLGIDITERKRAEHASRRIDERLRQATEAGRLVAWEMDLEGGRVTCTDGARELWGVTEASAEEFFARVHPDDREGARRVMRETLERGGPFVNDYRITAPDGEEHWLHSRGAVIADDDGRRRFVGVTADITPVKRAEQALREADRRRTEFLATLAHELRNPLAPIRNATHIMGLRAAGDGALANACAIVERQLAHMVRLIDDLLDASRITTNKLELRRARVALADVVEQALETSRPHVQDHRVDVSLPEEPVWLDADPVRLAQVFSNLLNNAFKFTSPGGTVRVAAEARDGEVRVSVRDSGAGMTPEQLGQLFEMFSQPSGSHSSAQAGLGIGLALARALARLHGGDIVACSEGPGRGSEFMVRLPLAAADPAAAGAGDAGAARGTGGPPRRFLVVDDNADAAASLAMLLELAGHEVHVAHDGEAAVEAAARVRPEIVLLDIGMPKLDGFGACRRMRAEAWGREAKILALTGWGQEEMRRRCAEAGFDGHLVKPVEYPAVMAYVAEAAHP